MRSSATRRLWARRAMKAGWFISPFINGFVYALSIPKRLLKSYFELVKDCPDCAIILAIGLPLGAVLLHMLINFVLFLTLSSFAASPSMILRATHNNECVSTVLKNKVFLSSVSIHDVVKATRDCDEREEDRRVQQEQAAVINSKDRPLQAPTYYERHR